MTTAPPDLTFDELLARARDLIVPGERRILGIAGAPGSGKSTLAEALAAELGEQAVLVGMDGFHLDDAILHRLDRHSRKGAPDTFDAPGYVALLRRLHDRSEPLVYAPRFDRSLESSIGSAVPVPADVPLVLTEGNYLLLDTPEWAPVRALLSESWFVDPGEDLRMERLIARHMRYGRSADEAAERSHGSDGRNADLVRDSRRHATLVVSVTSRG